MSFTLMSQTTRMAAAHSRRCRARCRACSSCKSSTSKLPESQLYRQGTCLPSAARSRPGPCPCSTSSGGESTCRLFEQMSFVLDFKASPPPGPFKFAMLFDLPRSLEPLPELPRGRGWCHLNARVLLFNPGYHTAQWALCSRRRLGTHGRRLPPLSLAV